MQDHPLDSSDLVNKKTQAERSSAMRERVIQATATCLQQYGYAGTTVSKIIECAGVSRGAPLHHFASKNALIASTAKYLVKRIYIQLNTALQQLEQSNNRLEDLIYASWKQVLIQPESLTLAELLSASQRDDELKEILIKLWTSTYNMLGAAADHYLEGITPEDNVRQLMMLTQWTLRGMMMDNHLIADVGILDHYVKLWCRVLAQHLKAKSKDPLETVK